MNNSNKYLEYYYEIHTDLILNGMPVHEADIHAATLTEERIGSPYSCSTYQKLEK